MRPARFDLRSPPGSAGASSSLLLALLLALPAPPAGGQPALPDAPLLRLAASQIERLQGGEAVPRDNLSRYFAAYPLAAEAGEAQRVLGAAERVVRGFAEDLYQAADARARAAGAAEIADVEVAAAVAERLPSAPTPWKTRLFFPGNPPSAQLEVEEMDLAAFGDTPMPWAALAAFVVRELLPAGELLPMGEAAAARFAVAVVEYGLLVFRLGGHAARAEKAPHVTAPHLRQAEKALEALARGEAGGLELPAIDRLGEAPDKPPGEPPGTSGGGPRFVEVTAESGVAFRHVSSDWLSRFRRYGLPSPTFSGGGVSTGDLDGDRLADLVFCGGEGCALYLGRGDGTFADATEGSGIRIAGEARMALVADLEGDGDLDLFVTYARDSDRLLENLGDGRFRDVTARAGLERPGGMSGPAVAADVDGDGLLDLYIGHFGDYLAGASPWIGPDAQNGVPNRLYRNLGDLRFEDVTEAAGAGNTGWAQALSHVDFDRDGDQDLYLANDFGRNELLENLGGGRFAARGAATASDDRFHGMNVAFADLNRDRHADVLITNIWGWAPTERRVIEHNTLLLSEAGDGGVRFRADPAPIPGLVEHDTGWGWAALFFDAENDGDDDLFMVNGLTDYSTFLQFREHPEKAGQVYPVSNGREANVFFEGRGEARGEVQGGGRLVIPETPSGAEMAEVNSRGLALLDFDLDGDLDLAVSAFHAYARLFRNDSRRAGGHLWLELVGERERGSSRDGVGAQVVARGPGGLYVWRTVTRGEGYLGSSAVPLHLGLGGAAEVELEVFWPGGEVQRLEGVAAGQAIRVHQGRPDFEKLPPP